MLRRLMIVGLLAWGVLAVPALCLSGVLEHRCACEIASNCAHEEDCGSDPCVLAQPATPVASVLALAAAPMLPSLPATFEGLTAPSLDFALPARPERVVDPPALRDGALPLLV